MIIDMLQELFQMLHSYSFLKQLLCIILISDQKSKVQTYTLSKVTESVCGIDDIQTQNIHLERPCASALEKALYLE